MPENSPIFFSLALIIGACNLSLIFLLDCNHLRLPFWLTFWISYLRNTITLERSPFRRLCIITLVHLSSHDLIIIFLSHPLINCIHGSVFLGIVTANENGMSSSHCKLILFYENYYQSNYIDKGFWWFLFKNSINWFYIIIWLNLMS